MSQILEKQSFLPIKFHHEKIYFLDQRFLPTEEIYLEIKNHEDCFRAIADMVVRGAPLIGFSGILGLALFAKNNPKATYEQFERCGEYLISARPTAVNLAYEILEVLKKLKSKVHLNDEFSMIKNMAITEMEALYHKNHSMAEFALRDLEKYWGTQKLNVVTICNTGTLACGVMGTAFGVINHLHQHKRIDNVFACETRPYLQGLRLTSYELQKEKIPYQIIVEGAMSYVFNNFPIHGVFVGADRIVNNGDTANKIGTSTLSIVAHHYSQLKERPIPFYVVAPLSTFDLSKESGDLIPIEMRPKDEILKIKNQLIANESTEILNPSFDVTDHRFITGIVCEQGIIDPKLQTVSEFLRTNH